nr:ribonuclease H-like domain-containing protein [Tanacetum cinerariifolium]
MCVIFSILYIVLIKPACLVHRFAGYATRAGFQQSKTNSFLFIYHRGSVIAYLLFYVDDIILTASSLAFLHRVIALLHGEFAMTGLGSLTYFLGISAQRLSAGLFLSQSTYAKEILERAHMQKSNPYKTPVDIKSKLGANGDCVNDPSLYRSLAEPHLAALKRILRYVRVTIDHGIQLHVSSTYQLTVYIDADWAGCSVTCRSTSGYCVFLCDNLLLWSAKRQVIMSRSSPEAE